MNKYAIILQEDFNNDMLNVKYPVNIIYRDYIMLEYVNEPDPIGDGWIIFDGENSNKDCYNYLQENLNEN